MSRKAKNTNKLYFEDKTSITFVMLPEGYFYKGKYYTVAGCFKALKKDGEVAVHNYPNGFWKCGHKLYSSLEELYEWEEDDIAMSYNQFKKHYKEYGVYHHPNTCTFYSYDKDDERELFDSKEQTVSELAWEVNDYKFLANADDYEAEYIELLSKEECIAYFKKPVKERIKILEEVLL